MKPAMPETSTLDEICRRWKISELAMFGSGARGELGPESDIDLTVRFAPDADWSLFDFAALADELGVMFGRRVDLVDADQIRNPYRAETISRDLTVLYAA